MNKAVKIALTNLGIGALCFGLFMYFALAGTPWQKMYYKAQLKEYLADKYQEEVVVTESIYNFKDGKYGVRAYFKSNPDLDFSAWQHYDQTKKYRDYYPEALWEYQINSEFEAVVQEIYPNAQTNDSKKLFHGVSGISEELNIGADVPHYSEVEQFFSLVIHEDKKLTEEIKNEEIEKLERLIQKFKDKQVIVDVLIVYRDKNDDTKNAEKYISINLKDNREYPTKEEIEGIFDETINRERS